MIKQLRIKASLIFCLISGMGLAGCQHSAVAPSFTGPFEGQGKLPLPAGNFELAPAATMMAPMRDGVQLATDVYRPAGSGANDVILIRTPYNKDAFAPEVSQTDTVATFVEHGYTVLVQDTRGRFESEGEFAPAYRDDTDSYDTMDWIVAQDWSNGVIGTFGCSYLGENQITAAHLQHPAWESGDPDGVGGRQWRRSRPRPAFCALERRRFRIGDGAFMVRRTWRNNRC